MSLWILAILKGDNWRIFCIDKNLSIPFPLCINTNSSRFWTHVKNLSLYNDQYLAGRDTMNVINVKLCLMDGTAH